MKKRKKILIIVAHPDDETIWMGGTILNNSVFKRNWDVKIISLCRKHDKDRAPKFARICKLYNAEGHMSDLEDVHLNKISESEIIKRIKRFVKPKENFDYIFTHGENGEYGHIRHKEVNQAVIEMVSKEYLKCNKIFFFSYIKKGKFCYPKKGSNKFIKLNNKTYSRKKYLIMEIYGFWKGGFEERCCRNAEAFNIREIK